MMVDFFLKAEIILYTEMLCLFKFQTILYIFSLWYDEEKTSTNYAPITFLSRQGEPCDVFFGLHFI